MQSPFLIGAQFSARLVPDFFGPSVVKTRAKVWQVDVL